MQIDPYCQWPKCSLVNIVSSDIRVMQIFAGVREICGVKQESGRLRCRFSYLLLAIFSEYSSPRLKSATHSICVKHDKPTQCCRAFSLALARLSCSSCAVLCCVRPRTPRLFVQFFVCNWFMAASATQSGCSIGYRPTVSNCEALYALCSNPIGQKLEVMGSDRICKWVYLIQINPKLKYARVCCYYGYQLHL